MSPVDALASLFLAAIKFIAVLLFLYFGFLGYIIIKDLASMPDFEAKYAKQREKVIQQEREEQKRMEDRLFNKRD